jgi:hypothetical protein
MLGYLSRKLIDFAFGKLVTPRLTALVKQYQYSHHYYLGHKGRPSKCPKCKHASHSRFLAS